jgi:molybdate transport system substrate-binding protein
MLASGAALLIASTACTGGNRGELVVSAAASLTDVFAAVEASFERAHPDVDVIMNFGGSSTLREQIRAGAPVDVFASASEVIARELESEGLVSDVRPFAANSVVIAVPAGNPAGVTSLHDFARPELLIGMCAEPVPCGTLAREMLAAADVVADPDTEEPDVRALVTKISLGELDAGLVYATDVEAVDGVDSIVVDGPSTRYVVAVVSSTEMADAAGEFATFVASDDVRSLLVAGGFLPP